MNISLGSFYLSLFISLSPFRCTAKDFTATTLDASKRISFISSQAQANMSGMEIQRDLKVRT